MTMNRAVRTVKETNHALVSARNAHEQAKQELEKLNAELKRRLTVGRNAPCKIAQLSSGEYVVHIYREEGPTHLFILEDLTDIGGL